MEIDDLDWNVEIEPDDLYCDVEIEPDDIEDISVIGAPSTAAPCKAEPVPSPVMSVWANCNDALLAACCVVIVLYLTKEVLDIDNVFPWIFYNRIRRFGYAYNDGPHTWPSGAAGRRQSPINVRSECVRQVDGCPPLLWPGYDVLPCKISITNDGTTVVLRGCWGGRGRAPAITGGPLGDECWPFAWAEFHWGPSDNEGSEHTLDYCRYALELQLVHGPCEGAKYCYVCVGVLFEVLAEDNPYLDPVVQALRHVRRPGCSAHLLPFPLDWLSPPMAQDYLSYIGSLTRPPCSESVLWILRPLPLTISSRQASEFRCLLDRNCRPLLKNTRPVQRMYGRPVCCYCG